jgi:hypothetical protein
MHKPEHGLGRKSDTLIVVLKRLTAVERRGVTVDVQLTRKGVPLDGSSIYYGTTGYSGMAGGF